MIEEYIENLGFGEPFVEGNILFIPVKGEDRGNGVSVLDEEIESGSLIIEDPGKIDTAVIDYNGDAPLFVMDGEEIVGARQNRIFSTSFITEAVENFEVPVVCVEEGRWSGDGGFRTGKQIAHIGVRSILAESILTSLKTEKGFRADQVRVWTEVRKTLERVNVSSKTLSLHDAYKRVDFFGTDYTPQPDTVGIMAFDGNGFSGADVFYSHKLFKKLAGKIIKSYLLGSFNVKGAFPTSHNPSKEIIKIREWKEFPSIGSGVEYRGEARGRVGKALVSEGNVVHLSIFRRQK